MKTNFKYSAFAFILVAAAAKLASAQFAGPYQGQVPGQFSSTPVVLPSYGTYDHASTLEEGAANGIANIIQAAGAGNLLHSQAARNYEEAYNRALDNKVKSIQTYYDVRKMNREYAAAARAPRPTAESMARVAKERAPSRLAAKDLDPLTGRIMWPAVLEDETYRPYREQLDELVAKWVRYDGAIGSDEYLALQQTLKVMEGELKLRIKDYPTADYVKAKSVLASLSYEVVKHETLASGGAAPAKPAASPKMVSERSTAMR